MCLTPESPEIIGCANDRLCDGVGGTAKEARLSPPTLNGLTYEFALWTVGPLLAAIQVALPIRHPLPS